MSLSIDFEYGMHGLVCLIWYTKRAFSEHHLTKPTDCSAKAFCSFNTTFISQDSYKRHQGMYILCCTLFISPG